ncbi:MAG: hypothetical protein AAGF12_30740 [Myxococcota bacterium]
MTMRSAAAMLSAVAVLAAACGDESRAPDLPAAAVEAPTETQSMPRPDPVPTGPCRGGQPRPIYPGADVDAERPVLALRVARNGERTVVVLVHGRRATMLAVDGSQVTSTEVPLPQFRPPVALLPVTDRFLLLHGTVCSEDQASPECLRAALLGASDGAEAITVPLGGSIENWKVDAAGSRVAFAHSHPDGPPRIELFDDLTELRHDTAVLSAPDAEGRTSYVLGVLAAPGRWAAAWRSGPLEGIETEAYLSRPDGQGDVEELHHALVVETMRFADDRRSGDVELVAGYEFSRPKHLRVRRDGVLRNEPRRIGRDAPLDDGFATRRQISFAQSADGVAATIRDAAGDTIQRGLELSLSGDRSATGAPRPLRFAAFPTSSGFVVALASGPSWRASLIEVGCGAGPER